MYKVIADFTDLRDNNHLYKTGDVYPREGYSANDKRIAFLAGKDNLMGKPVIAEVQKKERKSKEKAEDVN
jgi:hypothetical protein